MLKKINFNDYTHYFIPRNQDYQKEMFGHVAVSVADLSYTGAVRLAAIAALRTGAGKVSLVSLQQSEVHLLNLLQAEIMTKKAQNTFELEQIMSQCNVLTIGCGLGRIEVSKKWWQYFEKSNIQAVVDADALHLLAKRPQKRDNWILTPHESEAAKLLNIDKIHDRIEAVQEIQHRYGGIVILKGSVISGTLICTKNEICIHHGGNAGMATGGMGDLLAGIISGLLAQKIATADIIAKCAVCLHAQAGELASKDQQRGTLASDLLPYIRQLVNTYVQI